jgi:hypothetical protein
VKVEDSQQVGVSVGVGSTDIISTLSHSDFGAARHQLLTVFWRIAEDMRTASARASKWLTASPDGHYNSKLPKIRSTAFSALYPSVYVPIIALGVLE